MSKIDKNDKILCQGFTLVEILVAMFTFTVIVAGLLALFSGIFTSTEKQSGLLADSSQARRLAFGIMGELRNAETSSTGAYPLATAGEQELMFYSNLDGGGDVERVRYFIQDGKLYKGVLKPSGAPISYNPANESLSVVQDNLANGSSALFYYFDGSYDGVNGSALTQPVSVTDVKFAQVDLQIYNTAGLENSNTFTVAASGAVRNLKENLADPGIPDYFYQLTLLVSPPEGGSVAVSPEGPDYEEGSLANLTAYANQGYQFSGWTGNVNDPGSASTEIVMDQNQTVTANFTVAPETLEGSIYSKSGSQSNRRWNLEISNPNPYSVSSVDLDSFSLTQTAGPACSPVITSPSSFPSSVGWIAAWDSRTKQVRINFSGCNSSTRFTANFSFSGNSGADWGSATITNQAQ